MNKKQKGIIYTNSNCIGCNKCIIHCPIPGANISVKAGAYNRIAVDADKCISCGSCLNVCTHDAREYEDDTDEFLEDLDRGEKISLIIDSSFEVNYPDMAGRIINFLVEHGANKRYDASIGAQILNYCTLRFFDEHPEGGYVTSKCQAVVNYIEKYTNGASEYLLPFQSPEVCTAIYAKKYLKDSSRMAYIGPCPVKKDEFNSKSAYGHISYNVTYKHLLTALKNEKLEEYPLEVFYKKDAMGALYTQTNGTGECLHRFISRDKIILPLDNSVEQYKYIEFYKNNLFDKGKAPFLTDMINCAKGCVMGPSVSHEKLEVLRVIEDYTRKRYMSEEENPYLRSFDYEANKLEFYAKYTDIDIKDFKREFEDRFKQERQIPKSTLEEVFKYMSKDTEQSRCIDCHSCGYETCYDMAKAIAMGYNNRENCVYYEKDQNMRLYLRDAKTEIPNFVLYTKKIQELLNTSRARGYAAIKFSIFEWELVNDRFGYHESDKALIEFANAVTALIKENELVAHTGGISFMAIVRQARVVDFINAINKIVLHPNDGTGECDYKVSIYAGAYRMTDEDKNPEDVISKIRLAAREAQKKSVPTYVIYDEEMRKKIVNGMLLAKVFSQAIVDKEFVVYYQPQVNLTTMELGGAEALVRWQRDGRLIPPSEFIPFYERNGYIMQLDYYVLDRVCKDIKDWMAGGVTPVRVSSNFSKLHLKNPDFVKDIVQIIDGYNLPHELIEVEFTETACEDDYEKIKDVLNELKEAGLSSAIDDFGAGYSSLNLLSRFDFSTIKLDRAFLSTEINSPKARGIITSVIEMGHRIDMQIVAEGVEREEEVEFLKANGCDMIQGYFFDRPLKNEDFLFKLVNPEYTFN